MEGAAAEQADEADEARGVRWRRMVLGAFRGWVRIVSGPGRSRASQLIRGVRPTHGMTSEGGMARMAERRGSG